MKLHNFCVEMEAKILNESKNKYNEQKNDFLFSCLCYLGYKGDRDDQEALKLFAREIGLEIQVEYNNIRCLEIYTVKCKKKNYEQTAIFNYLKGEVEQCEKN